MITDGLNLLIGLLAIINPIAIAPIFVALTRVQSQEERSRTALQGAVASMAIMLVSFFVGEQLLSLFGIDIPAFRVAGGLLILSFGLTMARGQDSKHHPADRSGPDGEQSIAVVPLALPVTVGPGVISAIIVYASANSSPTDIVMSSIIILLASLVVYVTFRYAPAIVARLGPDGMSIATRISGLILATLGIQFIASGLSVLMPGLQ